MGFCPKLRKARFLGLCPKLRKARFFGALPQTPQGAFFGALPQTPQGGVAPLTRMLPGPRGCGEGEGVCGRRVLLRTGFACPQTAIEGNPLKLPKKELEPLVAIQRNCRGVGQSPKKRDKRMRTMLQGGIAVTPAGVRQHDLILSGGRIERIGAALAVPDDAEVVDVAGKYLLPGGIDAHTHITLNEPAVRGTDAYEKGTLAAIMGGTTTILDHMAFYREPETLRSQFERYRTLAGDRSLVDYSFHTVAQNLEAVSDTELAFFVEQGLTSIKVYTTYDFKLEGEALLTLFQRAAAHGMVTIVHAETDATLARLRAEFREIGRTEPRWHPLSRPVECEAEAVAEVLRLAAKAGDAPVYIAHLSTAAGLHEIQSARASGQKNVFAETCTQYLTLTDECYADRIQGLRFIMSPPLRTQNDVDALWQGLAQGDIQVVATDHCSFTLADKMRGRDDFMACPGGAPGMEERMSVIFSEGVGKKCLSLEQFAKVTAENPARIFGLPRKGILAEDADADILVLDPHARSCLDVGALHGPSDYSCYEGWPLSCAIDAVFLRGQCVAQGNRFTGRAGQGEFLHRERSTD